MQLHCTQIHLFYYAGSTLKWFALIYCNPLCWNICCCITQQDVAQFSSQMLIIVVTITQFLHFNVDIWILTYFLCTGQASAFIQTTYCNFDCICDVRIRMSSIVKWLLYLNYSLGHFSGWKCQMYTDFSFDQCCFAAFLCLEKGSQQYMLGAVAYKQSEITVT